MRQFDDHEARAHMVLVLIYLLFFTMQNQPYVIMKEGGGYEGFVIDILDKVAARLRFRYDMRPAADGLYGARDNRGLWNGMIGELQRRVRV